MHCTRQAGIEICSPSAETYAKKAGNLPANATVQYPRVKPAHSLPPPKTAPNLLQWIWKNGDRKVEHVIQVRHKCVVLVRLFVLQLPGFDIDTCQVFRQAHPDPAFIIPDADTRIEVQLQFWQTRM